jgi:hypothetical protein
MPDMTLALTVAGMGQVDSTRRAVAARAQCAGFDEAGAANAGAVAAHMASSLINRSAKGLLLVNALVEGDVAGLELIALNGPGVRGEILAAITPLVATSDSYSAPGQSAASMARLWTRALPVGDSSAAPEIGAVCIPAPGESVCGDGWWAEGTAERALIVLADGLGHGPVAHQAAHKARTIARAHPGLKPGALMALIHDGLHQTRGAAVLVAEIDLAQQTLTCCGVGNIAGMIVTPTDVRGLVSQHGTAGMNKVRLQEFSYRFPADALLVLHSDGLKSGWNLDRYPGLAQHQPCLIAAVLYRDSVRGRDDTTVVVLRNRQGLPQPAPADR